MTEQKAKRTFPKAKKPDWYEVRTDENGKEYKYYLVPSIKREVDRVMEYATENLNVAKSGVASMCGFSNINLFNAYFLHGTKPITFHQMQKLWKGVGLINSVDTDVDVFTVTEFQNYLTIERNFYPKFVLTMNMDDMFDYSIKINSNLNHIRNRSRYIYKYIKSSMETYYKNPIVWSHKKSAQLYQDFEYKFAIRDGSIFYNFYENYDKKDIPKHLQENVESVVRDFDIDVDEKD